jgi:peptidoglycan/LPS O-acetylase OafA/YrhL
MHTTDVHDKALPHSASSPAPGAGRALRWVAALTGAEAVSLAVTAALHWPDDAGIAEALIGVVLAGTAIALWRGGPRARTAALAGIGFAIAGFGVGLADNTAKGAPWPDIAYHLTVIPLLIGSFAALLRLPRRVR